MTDEERRNFLRMGLFSAAGAALGTGIFQGATGAMGERAVNVTESLLGTEQRPIDDLLNAFLGPIMPEISVGNFNMMRVAEGKSAKPSHYIMNSASRLVCALSKAHPEIELRMCGDFVAKPFDTLTDLVVLGGPMANPDIANLLGYHMTTEDRLNAGVKIPKADPNRFKLRWSQTHGETTLGEFNGTIHKAFRCEGGDLVERAQYAIHDHKTGNLLMSEVDYESRLLQTEWLQVVQLDHPLGFKQTFIWGLHGHSLLGFVGDEDELEKGLNAILSETLGMGSYQALVPVFLDHKDTPNGFVTRAQADWSRLKVENLELEL